MTGPTDAERRARSTTSEVLSTGTGWPRGGRSMGVTDDERRRAAQCLRKSAGCGAPMLLRIHGLACRTEVLAERSL